MKLINFSYGNYDQFQCVVNGKITMTPQEWQECYKHLKDHNNWTVNWSGRTKQSVLETLDEDVKRKTWLKDKTYLILIRIAATAEIARKYNLIGYRLNNYMLQIGPNNNSLKK